MTSKQSEPRSHDMQTNCHDADCPGCVVCQCGICDKCGLFEGCLTTECPGVQSYSEHHDRVHQGREDFVDGRWTSGAVSIYSPFYYRERAGQRRPVYQSDLSDREWEKLAADPTYPRSQTGRPASIPRKEIADAILYRWETRVTWRRLTDLGFPHFTSIHVVYIFWARVGFLGRLRQIHLSRIGKVVE